MITVSLKIEVDEDVEVQGVLNDDEKSDFVAAMVGHQVAFILQHFADKFKREGLTDSVGYHASVPATKVQGDRN